MPFDRRQLLQAGLLSTASALALPRSFAAVLREAADTKDGEVLFSDTFDNPTLAVKPSYTVLADVQDGFRWVHTPSIIEGRHGTLLASWSSNGPRGDEDPTNFLQMVRSTDKGATWSKPYALSTPSSIGAMFLRTKDGDPVLFYLRNHSLKQDDCSIVFRRTTDDGITWGEEKTVDIGATVAIMVNNGLTLPNGDWMISFHYDRAQQGDHFKVTVADYMSCVAISSDEGATWKRYDAAVIPNEQHSPNGTNSWAVEPAVVLTAKGMLRMVIRSMNGYLYETMSKDLGKTWSPVKKTIFSNDNSKTSLVEITGGKEVLLWNDTRLLDFQYRTPLIATLSEDDGLTWSRSLPIEDAFVTLDYPSAIQQDGYIKVVYGLDRRQMRFVNIQEADFRPWVPINEAGSWKIGSGVLSYAGDRPATMSETMPDWLQWSKVVSFLPKRGTSSTLSVDFRFDDMWPKDGVLGIFAAYQDESNWTAWCWHPSIQKAGFQQEVHFGSVTHPFYARNSSNYAFDHMPAPTKDIWYTVHITTSKDKISYRLLEKASGKELLTGSADMPWEGQFIGLGSRKTTVSFDNVIVR